MLNSANPPPVIGIKKGLECVDVLVVAVGYGGDS